jgi:hypothetical protein
VASGENGEERRGVRSGMIRSEGGRREGRWRREDY